ncbi:hypothetical protein AK830_g7690 [Neonectria ditissima]|uniref:Hypervirulence associated protein TUDOR domain-containing protein n=1 Tax=Neonectria ditissima TaxID=78410 RepID=A0A0P7AWF1_9HYPO|nr:hypothetical protein AK830_g7690 [Neonectria ditissima]
MKPQDQVVDEFNTLVNMTAAELEEWLKSDDSNSAGWPKEDNNGETVGHDSGRKIVEILKSNPSKDPENYTEDQVTHMRKVVAYCKRHLAQEASGNDKKSTAEVKKTKSYASLKNWGHDFLKAGHGEGKTEEKDASTGEDEKHVGEKRKSSKGQQGSTKKRETRKNKGKITEDDEEEKAEGGQEAKDSGDEVEDAEENTGELSDKNDESDDEDEDAEDHSDDGNHRPKRKATKRQGNGKKDEAANKKGAKAGDKAESKTTNGPEKGETVSWKWGSGQPEGEVLDVKAEE